MRQLSLLGGGGRVLWPHRGFLFPPPLRFAEVNRGEFGEQYPADACGAICLSFRALVRLSQNIRSTNWEMIQKRKYRTLEINKE
jgi:hypothetical protein